MTSLTKLDRDPCSSGHVIWQQLAYRQITLPPIDSILRIPSRRCHSCGVPYLCERICRVQSTGTATVADRLARFSQDSILAYTSGDQRYFFELFSASMQADPATARFARRLKEIRDEITGYRKQISHIDTKRRVCSFLPSSNASFARHLRNLAKVTYRSIESVAFSQEQGLVTPHQFFVSSSCILSLPCHFSLTCVRRN